MIGILKRLQNYPELLTNSSVNETCRKYGAIAYPKVRIADIIDISNSGISRELYSYALMAHFDTTVFSLDKTYPLFAVEFDGKLHKTSNVQKERDLKKNELCKFFRFPLLRIDSISLNKKYEGVSLLSWFVEVWFAYRWFEKERENGRFDFYEPFMTLSFHSIPGIDKEFPLWLSRNSRGKIARLCIKGDIEDFVPTVYIWIDQDNCFHCLAYVVIKDNEVAFTKNKMLGQQFPVPIHELLEDITVVDLSVKLENILLGNEAYQPLEQLNIEIIDHKSKFRFITGSGPQKRDIVNAWDY